MIFNHLRHANQMLRMYLIPWFVIASKMCVHAMLSPASADQCLFQEAREVEQAVTKLFADCQC